MKIKSFFLTFIACIVAISSFARDIWTPEQANAWYAKQPFRAGVNYIPSYAINTIEVWQKETFKLDVFE